MGLSKWAQPAQEVSSVRGTGDRTHADRAVIHGIRQAPYTIPGETQGLSLRKCATLGATSGPHRS